MMETVCSMRVFNPHSGNPTKYKGNLNQKSLYSRAAPKLSSAVGFGSLFMCSNFLTEYQQTSVALSN